MVRAKDEADRNCRGNIVITVVLSIVFAVLSWEVLTALLPFVLKYPAYGLVIFIALGVLSLALRPRILFSSNFLGRLFYEVRVNIMLSVGWEKGDLDETLEALDLIKIKQQQQHRRVPSLQQRQASASGGIGIPPSLCKKKNGTIHKRK